MAIPSMPLQLSWLRTLRRQTAAEVFCVAMSCGGGGFTRDGACDFVWDSVRPMTGKYTFIYFQYQEDVGCVCMLNAGSAAMTIFALTTTSFPVQVEGQVSQ